MNAPCPNVTVKHALVAESRLPFCYCYYSGTQQVILQKNTGGQFFESPDKVLHSVAWVDSTIFRAPIQ